MVDKIFALLWIIIAGYTSIGFVRRLAATALSTTRKLMRGIVLFGTWAGAQVVALLFVFFNGYCENCADRPVTIQDVFMYLVLLGPNIVALMLFLSTSPKNHDRVS